MRRCVLVVCLWLAGALSAAAERRVALVLGIEDYEVLRPLENPVNDARAVETLLEGLGFEVFLETDRDLKRLRRALEDFREDAAGADVALLFYAGHGVAMAGENFLLPTDADAATSQSLRDTALPLAEAQAALAAVAPVTLMLLDACRNDPFQGGGDGRSAVPLSGAVPQPDPGFGRMGRADGLLVAFAAAPNETASDGSGENSPFTEALVRHFGTSGVEVRTALTLVQQDVYDRSRGAQLPYVESGVPELVFLTAAGDLPERDQLLIAMANLTPDLRAEVEAMALARDMPLAPLFGAVIAADLASLAPDQRQVRLTEAADGFAAFRAGLQGLASDDPQVARLRAEAEAALTLGAAGEARALLARAVAIDAAALETLTDRVKSRTLSQAETHLLAAQVSTTDLRYDLALADLAAAVALFATVEGPDLEPYFREVFSIAMWDLGKLHTTLGQTSQALQVFEDWQKISDARLAEDPANLIWKRDAMAVSLQVSGMAQAQGDLLAAGTQLRRVLDFAAELSTAAPQDRVAQRDLMVAYDRLGLFFLQTGDLAGAEVAFREGLAIARGMVVANSADLKSQFDLATSLNYLASVLANQDKFDAAADLYTEGVEVSLAIAATDPDDAAMQLQVAVSYGMRGDSFNGSGKPEAALADYQMALDTVLRLAARDPADTNLQRIAHMNYFGVGSSLHALGQTVQADSAFAEGMKICSALAALDPANVEWQTDLVICHYDMGTNGPAAGRLGHLQSALTISEQLAADGRLPLAYADWIDEFRAEIAAAARAP